MIPATSRELQEHQQLIFDYFREKLLQCQILVIPYCL
jgi:hypothetical protein